MLLVVDSTIRKYGGGFCREKYLTGDVRLRLGYTTSIFISGHLEQRRSSMSSYVIRFVLSLIDRATLVPGVVASLLILFIFVFVSLWLQS